MTRLRHRDQVTRHGRQISSCPGFHDPFPLISALMLGPRPIHLRAWVKACQYHRQRVNQTILESRRRETLVELSGSGGSLKK